MSPGISTPSESAARHYLRTSTWTRKTLDGLPQGVKLPVRFARSVASERAVGLCHTPSLLLVAHLTRQCLDQRVGDRHSLIGLVAAWQRARNGAGISIEWSFTRQGTDCKLGRHYVT